MADPNLDSLSVEDLLAMKRQAAAPQAAADVTSGTNLDSLSVQELMHLKNSTVNQDWTLGNSLKNFGSGVIEGTTGLVGLAADLNPFQYGGPQFNFPASKAIASLTEPYLAEKDPQYRYARTAGTFAAPIPIKGANTVKSLLTSVLSGLGAQYAEDTTGDTKIAPIVGALATGSAVSGASDLLSLLKRVFVGSSKEEIAGSAAKALIDRTGLTTADLKAANMGPQNILDPLKTTAEKTGNAGIAQIEKTLAGTGDNANIYAALDAKRAAARENLLNAATTTTAVNPEGLGASLIDTAETVQGKMKANSSAFWGDVPRNEDILVEDAQKNLSGLLGGRQAGLPINPKVQNLVSQITDNKDAILSSGALQDIRSDALTLMRDRELTGFEKQLLTGVQENIDSAMAAGLSEKSYQTWKAARQSTAAEKATFGRGTAGGYLTGDTARISTVLDKVFKGDAQAVTELKDAIGQSPALLEDVKRGVLDMIPRDVQGQLTPNGMKRFLSANESGLKALFGENHYLNMGRIFDDLKSQANVKNLADLASKGGSATSQRNTVAGAIQTAITESLVPGIGGRFSGVIDAIKQGAGIKDAKAVEDLLFKAALDSKFAEQLSRAPTNRRIYNALESLSQAGRNIVTTGAIGTAKELTRDQDNRTPLAKLLDKVTAEKGASNLAERTSMTNDHSDTIAKIKADPYYSALAKTESNFNPQAVPRDKNGKLLSSAKGLFQFTDATAKAVGLKDPFNPAQAYEAVQKLTDQHKAIFGDDPKLLYAAHFLGASLLRKVLAKKPLTETEQQHVTEFKTTALPNFEKNYRTETTLV